MNNIVNNPNILVAFGKPAHALAAGQLCVLQLIPSLDAGGAERACLDMASALHAQGGRALVVSQGGRMEGELAALGGILLRLPVASKNPLVMLLNGFRIARLARAWGIDLIHARSRAPAWSGLLASWLTGAPMLTTFHGFYSAGNVLKRLYNSVMVRGVRVITGSHFMAAHVMATYAPPPGRVAIIARGIDMQRFDPAAVAPGRVAALRQAWRIPDAAQIVLLPGRLTRWKGQLLLIEALAKLNRKDVVAVMAGDAQGRQAYVAELLALAERHAVTPQVRLTGNIADMPAAYAMADVVVSASTDAEAFGRVPVEAMAMGCAVVAADHGGVAETLRPPGGGAPFGILFAPANAEALAGALGIALSHVAEDRDAPATLLARAHVGANYSTDVMCARTLALYREILSKQ